ncbi:MAG: MFS transporter [Halolamina sp.]
MSRLGAVFGEDADVLENRNFQLLLLGSLCSPIGESAVSPVLDTLAGPYGVGVARVSLLMAVYTAPAIVVIPLVGLLSDKYGRRPVLAAGLTLLGVAGLGLPFTTDFRVALALRALQGIGYCGTGPVLITSVGDIFSGDREATAQGVRFTVVSAALGGFPLLAGLLVGVSWRAPLFLFAVTLPVAGAVLLFMQEPTAEVRPGARPEEACTDGGDEGAEAAASTEEITLREALKSPGLLALLVGRGTPGLLWFAFLSYASVVVVRLLGGTPAGAGALVAVASAAAGVGSTQVGRLSATSDSRFAPMVGTGAVAGLGVAAVALAPSLLVAGIGAAVFGAAFSIVLSLYRSTITTRSPDAVRGTVVSLGESVGRLGSTLGPVLTGAIIAGGTVTFGFEAAVRLALLATVVLSVGLSAGCLVVASRTGLLDSGADGASA